MDGVAKKLLLHPWFRLTRGLTLGVRAALRDEHGRFLLIRHGYTPGWHLPGGGVERGETMLAALHREVEEETGARITGQARLFGIYHNGSSFPGDHVGLFVIDDWNREAVPRPNAEIAEQGFFEPERLPDAVTMGTARRIAEIVGGLPPSAEW
ncbi:MAG: NUDIX domain-containing protein [Flavobacteriaceae bacterium]